MRTPFSIYKQHRPASLAQRRRLRHAKGLKANDHGSDADGNVGTPDTLTPRRADAPTHGWLRAETPRIHRLAA